MIEHDPSPQGEMIAKKKTVTAYTKRECVQMAVAAVLGFLLIRAGMQMRSI